MVGWLLYFGVVFVASLILGRHLGRFREACSEMTGMMAGMTIGMLGGFALGYGMAAATERNLFMGNLIGVLLGAALGGWLGRPGGLMGIMDGSMGGIMGGSMGAMIAVMLYPDWALNWTGALFAGAYVIGAVALIGLIESRTPEHAHMHWLLPKLARNPQVRRVYSAAVPAAHTPDSKRAVTAVVKARVDSAPQTQIKSEQKLVAPPMQDYYAVLRVARNAALAQIEDAYLDLLADADPLTVKAADRALVTLRDPERRAMYDSALAESMKRQAQPRSAPRVATEPATADARGDCCPPPKKKSAVESQPQAPNLKTAPNSATPAPTMKTIPTPAYAPTPARASGSQSPTRALPTLAQAKHSQATRQTRPSKANREQRSTTEASSGRAHDGRRYDSRANRDWAREQKAQRQNRNMPSQQDGGFARKMAVGAGVGMSAAGGAMLVLVFVFAGLFGGNGVQAAGNRYNNPQGAIYHVPGSVPNQAQLEKQAVTATVGTDGVQRADLVLDDTNSSYKPAAIKVKKGVPVSLNLSELGGSKDCRDVVRLTGLGVQGFVEPGKVTSMDFTPSQTGVYEFNCPMRMVNPSYLVVTD